MSKKRYPKSAIKDAEAIAGKEAFVSWEDNQAEASQVYAAALEESAHSIANRRDYSGLTTYADGGPGLRSADFDWFRPGQAAPTKPKDIISFGRYAYRRIGLIHNAIDLMGDFTCQGIRLAHPNKSVENFMNDWFKNVGGKHVSERLAHLLFREGNVPIRSFTAKVNKKKRAEMQRSVAAEEIDIKRDDVFFSKGEIPWRYNFIDPILVEPVGGALASLTDKKLLMLKIPTNLKSQINRMQQSRDPEIREVLKDISPDIIKAVNGDGNLLLPPDKTSIYHYKKDDWQTWADPLVYSAFEPINQYQRLQLTDKAALDGATSKIRVWKIGSLEHKLAPTPTAAATLSDMLGANVGGGTIDIIWGPDIELLETATDVQGYLGEDKYRPVLMAIYATLGIPPTLTGTFGASGTTNNFISLKTLTERLNYVRSIVAEFWNEQIKIVQKAMGFRTAAHVEFDYMYLDDPASIISIMLNMVDRNMLSDEFVQRHIKAKPDVENIRVQKENKAKDKKEMEKISPFHQVDKDFGLKKIALQTGISSPSEVGLELDDKKDGENSLMDMKEKQMKTGKPLEKSGTGVPGRPKNSNDTTKRKTKVFKPKTKASAEVWAKLAQKAISDIVNPIALEKYGKSTLRKLTSSEVNDLEGLKFDVLCNLKVGDEISLSTVLPALGNTSENIHTKFSEWVADAEQGIGKRLSMDQLRDLRVSYYVEYNYGSI